MMPEALDDLHAEHDSPHELGLYAGVAVLGGMSFSVSVHALVESGHPHSQSEILHDPAGIMRGDGELMPHYFHGSTARPTPPAKASPTNLQALIKAREERSLFDLNGLKPVCWNVIAGDLAHNFADGVAIGAAFLRCSTTIGWTTTAFAPLHKLPLELADFVALLHGGMSVKQAFAYNFLSALSAVLGTIMVLALGSALTDAQISIVLLVGAGSFIFIALTELLPEAL
ncbi:unnamed protein product, partial [Hapterophycus canaliculatus]